MSTDTANRKLFVLVLAVLAMAGLATAAQAGPNLVQNGTFSGFAPGNNTSANGCSLGSTSTTTSQLTNCDLPNWWSTGIPSGGNYTFILPAPYTQGTNFLTTNNGSLGLRGPGNTTGSVIPVPPSGSSHFLAADGAYQTSYTYTTVTGLIVGYSYNITFNMAASQQAGSQFNGPTTDTWQVGLSTGTAGCSMTGTNTPGVAPTCLPNTGTTTSALSQTITLPTSGAGQGFSGWIGQEITLVASAASEVLWFFGQSTALSQLPPFVLLDGVSMTVPEPPAYGVLMVALLGLLGVRRVYRRKG